MRARFLLLALALLPAMARADDATETALRAALAQSTTQIANLENQVANLQAAQAPDTAMIEALKAQVQLLQKGGAAPGAAPVDGKAVAALRHTLAARNAALEKSQAQYAAAAQAAAAQTAANARLTSQLAALNARVNSCDAKNAALFALGNQILDAYSHKDDPFGVIANREPFIGFKRVQLQNIVQNDQQSMLNDQITQ